jgi:hypothetical protein
MIFMLLISPLTAVFNIFKGEYDPNGRNGQV